MADVFGYWHKIPSRCDYCHKPREQVYVVRDGDCTGKFCGRDHFITAQNAKRANQIPEHELPQEEQE